MPTLGTGPPHEGKDVAGPITDTDPTLARRSGADGFDYLRPHIALLATLGPAGAGLGAFLDFVPCPDLLGRQAQDLRYSRGMHGQAAVQEKPASAGVADPAQILRVAMSGEVQIAGVLHKQDGAGLSGLLARGLPMRLAQGAMSHVRFVQQTVRRLHLAPGAGLFGQAVLRTRGEGCPELHSAASAAHVAQSRGTPLLLRPAQRVRQGTQNHMPRL
jgi:hypothetical protein